MDSPRDAFIQVDEERDYIRTTPPLDPFSLFIFFFSSLFPLAVSPEYVVGNALESRELYRVAISQPDIYSSMRNQPLRDIIRYYLETMQDMNLIEQELDQWIEQKDQETEEEIKSILHTISAETISTIPVESVKVNKVTPVKEYCSEPEETLEVSLHEPYIEIAQNIEDEAEKEIEFISEWSEEPQKESKEDQPLVYVKPPTLPCILVEFKKGVVVKERSQIFYNADTFMSNDHDATESFMLEVSDELSNMMECMPVALSKAIDASFVIDISKGEGIT
ncbi:hypothetical protein Sjap_020448 [Stephania japonica]|uniref:Uncharacterized protein n=1 Tax=Stephania japonica TaxID=461633 RepID=A0AAP0F9N0_9MAGN